MIIGEKVLICGLTHESAPKIYEWVNQPELKRSTGTLYPVSEYEHGTWIQSKAQSPTDKLFLVKDKVSHEDIGTIGLKNIDWVNRNAELYISLGNMEYISKNGGVLTAMEVMQ